MKHEKRLQRWMKKFLSQNGLNPDNYCYIKNTPGTLEVVHRHSLKTKIILKGEN